MVSMAAPAVSVIVPTHDRRPLLERKLRAIGAQAASVPFEVVVAADACRDDTVAFLESYRAPFVLAWTEVAVGQAAAARNAAVAQARAPLLLFSDDDVVPRPGWLDAHVGHHKVAGRAGLSTLVRPDHLTRGVVGTGFAGWWHCASAGLSVERGRFEAVGGYDTSLGAYGGEDSDLGWRLHRAGVRFGRVRRAVAEHWDEGFDQDAAGKAMALGRAQVHVVRNHRAAGAAWLLGVHPTLLALKRLALRALPPGVAAWERAFTEGASRALRDADADLPGKERP